MPLRTLAERSLALNGNTLPAYGEVSQAVTSKEPIAGGQYVGVVCELARWPVAGCCTQVSTAAYKNSRCPHLHISAQYSGQMPQPESSRIECPLCHSTKVRLVVILPTLLIYVCDTCFAQFTIPKPESD
jgi:hypothetical protein